MGVTKDVGCSTYLSVFYRKADERKSDYLSELKDLLRLYPCSDKYKDLGVRSRCNGDECLVGSVAVRQFGCGFACNKKFVCAVLIGYIPEGGQDCVYMMEPVGGRHIKDVIVNCFPNGWSIWNKMKFESPVCFIEGYRGEREAGQRV
jgi:hypothetical protein